MADVASTFILDWRKRQPAENHLGFIAVAFDQRNHGTRVVHKLANESWKSGNESHAQDMFSIFHGTAIDTSLLIDHLESYIFHSPNAPVIQQHLVAGISLGGHAAWQVFFNEPRVTAAVVIIGSPDYASVMSDRARLSKRKSYIGTKGSGFFGSTDFPNALVSSVERFDPKGMLFGSSDVIINPSETEQTRLREILDKKVRGKRVLICSGGADKLVPYHCGEPFLKFLKNATSGWYKDGNVYIEDIVYPGVGHTYSEGMTKDTTRFIGDILADAAGGCRGASKI